MEQLLFKNERLKAGYKIKFFMEGGDVFQKYRVSGDDGNTYSLIIYNSAKLLKESFSNDALLETEILALFNTDSIIKLIDSGEMVKESRKYHYIVTNFISGETLQEKLERGGPISQYAAVPIVINLLEALGVLHEHPKVIVHNNVNLKSVVLDYSSGAEKPVLSGFNFAREITSKINTVDLKNLSPFYIAPELYNGVFTPQSDVFSAGASVFDALAWKDSNRMIVHCVILS